MSSNIFINKFYLGLVMPEYPVTEIKSGSNGYFKIGDTIFIHNSDKKASVDFFITMQLVYWLEHAYKVPHNLTKVQNNPKTYNINYAAIFKMFIDN